MSLFCCKPSAAHSGLKSNIGLCFDELSLVVFQ